MDDLQQWKKVAFLVANGFRFFHQQNAQGERVPYPATLAQAKEFVALYRQTPSFSIGE